MTFTKKASVTARRLASQVPEAWMGSVARAHELSRHRFRRVSRQFEEMIAQSECWHRDELTAHTLTQLRRVIAEANEYVPYYRTIFKNLGIDPADINCLDDFRLLPVLNKRDLQENQHELLARNIQLRDRVYFTTAGSTGVPVGFFQDKDTAAKDRAFMVAQWSRVGYRKGDRTAILRGAVVRGNRLFERDPFQNALVMSSYHLTDELLPQYVSRLKRFRPRFLRAYPSSATLLARFMIENREPPIEGLRAVLCGSENLYDWQRELIAQAFACRVFSWYGQSERVCLAGECEFDTKLHIFPQYGFIELLDENGGAIEEPGQPGEVVATGFLNHAMPLIRYRTSDIAIRAEGTCQLCRRPYDLIERIEGRLQEFIVSHTGRYVSMTAINMHSPVFDNVHQFRFRQIVPGTVVLLIVPRRGYEKTRDESAIRAELAPKLGPDFDFAIEVVDQIPRTGRGKFRFLDQELPGPFDAAS